MKKTGKCLKKPYIIYNTGLLLFLLKVASQKGLSFHLSLLIQHTLRWDCAPNLFSCLLYDGFKYDLYRMDENYQESGDTRFRDEIFYIYE